MIITIDGPTASGKSSIAKRLAYRLSAYYVYSGLLYRALAYALSRQYRYTHETIAQADPAHVAWCMERIRYTYHTTYGACITFQQCDITPYLKNADIDALASAASQEDTMRRYVYYAQHRIAASHSVIVDGRDAGTTVFPQAHVKFYVTAAEYIRILRWRGDQRRRGYHHDVITCFHRLKQRDRQDSSRHLSPLQQAPDAFYIDTSQLSVDCATALMCTIIAYLFGNIDSSSMASYHHNDTKQGPS